MFDYPPGELIGQPLSRLLPGAVPEPHDDQWTTFWKNPHSAAMIRGRTIAGIRRDGVRCRSKSVSARSTTARHAYMIASIVDITERLNLEARLAAATNAHLGFQRLVADVAVRFGAVDPDASTTRSSTAFVKSERRCSSIGAVLWRWDVRRGGRVAPSALGAAVVPRLPSRCRLRRSRSWPPD